MKKKSILNNLLLVIFFNLLVFSSFKYMMEQQKQKTLISNMQNTSINLNINLPILSSEAINFAIHAFTINTFYVQGNIEFDPEITDRGLTIGGLLNKNKKIVIGSSAFSSWSILGSTIAHESEIHATQSFLAILLLNNISSTKNKLTNLFSSKQLSAKISNEIVYPEIEYGTWQAERTAYNHELKNNKRFSLSKDEFDSIKRVLHYYYPSPK